MSHDDNRAVLLVFKLNVTGFHPKLLLIVPFSIARLPQSIK
jgi:hypothetical protein